MGGPHPQVWYMSWVVAKAVMAYWGHVTDSNVKGRVTSKLQESHATQVKGQVTEQWGVT